MIFYIESHKPAYPRIEIKANKAIFSLVFITIGMASLTMSDIQEKAASAALENLQRIVLQHGVEGLDGMVHDAINKARETDR